MSEEHFFLPCQFGTIPGADKFMFALLLSIFCIILEIREDEAGPCIKQCFGGSICRFVEIAHILPCSWLNILLHDLTDFFLSQLWVIYSVSELLGMNWEGGHKRWNDHNSSVGWKQGQELLDEVYGWGDICVESTLGQFDRWNLDAIITTNCSISDYCIELDISCFDQLCVLSDWLSIVQVNLISAETLIWNFFCPFLRKFLRITSRRNVNLDLWIIFMK
jgi:hypothetical protein